MSPTTGALPPLPSHEPEIEELKARLAEAEETLHAIRQGDVDAVIIATESTPQVYTLLSADRPYRNFVERMQEGALTLTPAGTILYANQRLASFLDLPLPAIIGRNFRQFIDEGDLDLFAGLLSEDAKTCSQAALALRVPDGASVPVNLSAADLSDEGQNTISVIVTDLRWQKQQIADLAEANAKLVKALEDRERTEAILRQAKKMEALGQLTAGIAHDFNNLLFAISGNLELFRARTKDTWLQNRVEASQRAVERGQYLTQQLLAFGRLQHLHPQPISVNALLLDLDVLLRSCVGDGVRLFCALGDDVGDCLADMSELQAAILNLATNARDAMAEGGALTITTETLDLEGELDGWVEPIQRGRYVSITVTDTGHGMPAETLARAFDPFFTTKDAGKGAGLGLSRLYGFIRQSNGYVTIASMPQGGTTVRLYLPRSESVAEAVDPVFRTTEKPSRAHRILVVEDDKLVRELVVEVLESSGYDTVAVNDGLSALDHLEGDSAFEVMLSDVLMPDGMSGFQLAREVQHRLPTLPIVLSSGMAGLSGDAEAAALGLSILRKPYRGDDLLRTIDATVEANAIRRSPR